MRKAPRSTLFAALPVAAAVGVFGVSYGVLGTAAGIPGWQLVLLSVCTFAGSAQFAFVSAFATGAGPLGAIVSGGLLNTRYLATGAVAAQVLPGGRLRRLLLAQLVVDESYVLAVAAGTPARPDPGVLVAAGALEWLCWVTGSAVGVLIGNVLGDPARLGFDAAFPALFIALLWPLLDGPGARRCALGGALAAALVAPWAPGGVPLAAAALAGLLLSGRDGAGTPAGPPDERGDVT
ncbi:MAG TPA: AzlC family ABC transporter permease [Acidimicrobiales bacterium]|nr:AzlC family ABC transporter permease [Acidimicrobiales bacterium]